MIDLALMGARAVHFGSSLLIWALWFFSWGMLRPSAGLENLTGPFRRFYDRMTSVLWPLAFGSAAAWFLLVAAQMVGAGGGGVLSPQMLWAAGTQTHFGKAWQIHNLWGLAALCFSWPEPSHRGAQGWRRGRDLACLIAFLGWIGSLAWAGHGLLGSATLAPWHLGVDVLHLVVGGVWPGGLVPLVWILRQPGFRQSQNAPGFRCFLQRFSDISLAAVFCLALTGISSWLVVQSWAHLISTKYGLFLSAKILLFCLMIGLGFSNRRRVLAMHLNAGGGGDDRNIFGIEDNVRYEIAFSTAIIGVVAILGVLSPG